MISDPSISQGEEELFIERDGEELTVIDNSFFLADCQKVLSPVLPLSELLLNSRTLECKSRPIASAIAVNQRRDSRRNNKNIYQKSVLQDKVHRNSLCPSSQSFL